MAPARRPDALVLCYHAVERDLSPLAIAPDLLEWQLRLLARRGFRSVTFAAAARGNESGCVVAVTFDDGFSSVATEAAPVLARHGFVGTLFVPPATVGFEGVVTWEQVRRLAAQGWEIGAHGLSHRDLTTLSDDELRDELTRARALIEDELSLPCRSLAYPYGSVGAREVAAARAAGFESTCATGSAARAAAVVPRVGISSLDGKVGFRLKIARPLRAARSTPLAPALDTAGRIVRRRYVAARGFRET